MRSDAASPEPNPTTEPGLEGESGRHRERAKNAGGDFGLGIVNNDPEGQGCVTLDNGECIKTDRCQERKRAG